MTCLIRLGVTLLIQIHIQLLPDSEALLHLIISSSRRLCLCFHHHILPFPPIFFSDRSAQAIYFFFFLSFFLKNPHITVCFAQKHTFHPRAFIWKGKWLSGQEKHFWQRKCRASFSLRWNRKPCCLPFLCLCYTYACMESSWGDGWLEVGCLWYRDRQRSIIYGGGKKSCLLCLVSYVKANIYFTPLDHTRRSSHA